MATGIPWCDDVLNWMSGCEEDMPCRPRCWALDQASRLCRMGAPGYQGTNPFSVRYHPAAFDKALKRTKPTIYLAPSMGEWMDPRVERAWIAAFLHVVDRTPQHTYLTLTKQPENFGPKLFGAAETRDNLRLGVSVTGPEDLHRIHTLCETPAEHRWVNIGPFVEGPIDISEFFPQYDYRPTYPYYQEYLRACGSPVTGKPDLIRSGIEWVCVECESGKDRRPMRWAWLADIIDQCDEAGVPCFIKQVCMPKINNGDRVRATDCAEVVDSMCTVYGTRVSHAPAAWPEWARRREVPASMKGRCNG